MPRNSPATYVRTPDGITKSEYKCSCHGQSFPSRQIMQLHAREFKRRIARDLQALVREGTLGQDCWDRLPGETPQQYHRFRAYLTHRKLESVAKICGVKIASIRSSSSQWQWVFRTIAYDDNIARIEMEEFDANKKRSARRQAKLGQRLQDAALIGAHKLIERVEEGDVEMTGNEIAKLADVGVKIERLANQDPTAIKEDRGIRFVWEGPRPSWAPKDPEEQLAAPAHPEPKQIEATLVGQVTPDA